MPLKDISLNQNVSKWTNNSQKSNFEACNKKAPTQTTSSSYYCETEPVYPEKKTRMLIPQVTPTDQFNLFFKEEDFERIVEYTESDEDGDHDDLEDNK